MVRMSEKAKSKTSQKSILNKVIRHLREWHRKLGIMAAFFLIFLSLTGIALNHTDSFELAHQPITNEWLLDHYGINAPARVDFYQQEQLIITDNLVWLADKLLMESAEPVISAAKFQQFWLVLSSSQLSVFNTNGELVDKLDSSFGLPDNITGLSVTNTQVILNTQLGYFQSDVNLLQWQQINTLVSPEWIVAEQGNSESIYHAALKYKSQFLNLERIVVDAHSGRIFGNIGVLLMDLVAIMLVLLSVSGVYIWLRYSRAKR
jgi:hypothetical protein